MSHSVQFSTNQLFLYDTDERMPTTYEDEEDDDYDDGYDDDSESDVEECPSCGEDVYEDAEQCPHCGEYIEHFNRRIWDHRPMWWKVLGLLGIVMVILAFSGPLLRLILNLN